MGKRDRTSRLHPNVDGKTPGAEAASALLYATHGGEVVPETLYRVHEKYVSVMVAPASMRTADEFRKIVEVATMPGVCVDVHVTDKVEVRISSHGAPFRLPVPRKPIANICEEVRAEVTRIFTALQHEFVAHRRPVGMVGAPENAPDRGVGTARIRITREPDVDGVDVFGITRMCNYLADPDAVDMWWEFEEEFINLFVRRCRTIEK